MIFIMKWGSIFASSAGSSGGNSTTSRAVPRSGGSAVGLAPLSSVNESGAGAVSVTHSLADGVAPGSSVMRLSNSATALSLASSAVTTRRMSAAVAGAHARASAAIGPKILLGSASSSLWPLIRAHAGGLERRAPLRDLALDEGLQVFGRAPLGRDQRDPELVHAILERRRIHRFDRGVVELLDDGRGRALRHEEGVPGDGFEIGEALLVRGCQRRQERRTVARQQRDAFEGVACDLWKRAGAVGAHVVDLSRDQICRHRSAAAIGNMRDVEPGRAIEQCATEMGRGAPPGRAVLQLRRVRLGIGDELLQGIGGEKHSRGEYPPPLDEQRGRGGNGGGGVMARFFKGLGGGGGVGGVRKGN